MPGISLFGQAPRVTNIVLRQQFTGDGSTTTFQLTSSAGNCTFNTGSWSASRIQTAYPAHATGTDKKPTYDSAVYIVRNRIGVSSIDSSGLVTLDYAPRLGVDFYVWYWYQLQAHDEIDTYREDFVASMEVEAAAYGDQIVLDVTNFDGILGATDTTVQQALETIDDYAGGGGYVIYVEEGDVARANSSGANLYIDFDDGDFDVGVVGNECNISLNDGGHVHDGATLQLDGINSDGGAFSFTTSGAITFSNTVNLTTCINAGVDTDKFLVLDAGGNIDFRTGAEILSDIGGSSVTDHGALTGLEDDDHTHYLLADGTRALTGNLSVNAGITIDGVDISTLGSAYSAHLHDTHTLQCDGINSDGGAFAFNTSSILTFSNTVALTTCADASADVDKFLVLDLSNNIDYRTGAEVLSDIGASASSHLHDGATLQLDGVNSDGGAFSFTTSGTLTFSNTMNLTTCINAGVDTDKFLVLDASNNVDYRTGAEVLSDIDAALGEAGTAAGQMLFWDTTKWAHTETTELFWDDTNKRLGIGIDTPQQRFHIKETSASAKMQIHTTFATGYAEILFKNEGNVPSSWAFRSIAGDGSFQFVDYDNSTVPIRIEKGALTDTLYLKSTGRVGVGISTPLSKLHVDQASTTAAIPSLYLNQADISEQMITFNTTIGVGNAIEAIGAKTLTTTHFIKVTIPGPLTRYIPVGTIA